MILMIVPGIDPALLLSRIPIHSIQKALLHLQMHEPEKERVAKYLHSHLATAMHLLAQYNGQMPFSHFSKQFFSEHKKYGSKDRKNISHLCYCFFRLGKALAGVALEEKIMAALFLCAAAPNDWLATYRPAWNDKANAILPEKIALLVMEYPSLSAQTIFPWWDQLSDGIDATYFALSHLQQPDVFIRIRPGHESQVKEKLLLAGIAFEKTAAACLALPNASKIDAVLALNKEVVVQDLSSQQVGELMQLAIQQQAYKKQPIKAWDCCAASGGKSIMLHDLYPGINLMVSDVRASILENLKKRFRDAGIINYTARLSDLSNDSAATTGHMNGFDFIIADVPCSGSGTWARTPEQLLYFDENKIAAYSSLQQKIVKNALSQLKAGGCLLYITCSVFKRENEDAADFIQQQGLQLLEMQVLKGYDKKADTMFAALFVK